MTASGRGLKPLAGFVVVDFSTTLPGVQASQYLADNGAEVIHVERPGGCGLRKLPGWPALGRGKKSIVLDLKQPDDARLAFELAASADVVIETYRPGVADRLGLGYAALSAVRPDLIYTSISGWGKDSPYRQAKGYEGLVSARLGVYDSARLLTARPGPAFMATNVASYGAMQAALLGTLTALLERESSGRGQQVEASLAMGLASLEVWNWALHTMYDLFPDAVSKSGPFSESGIPQNPMLFKLLTCLSKEGEWLQFAQVQPRLFRAFMRAIDLEWMFDDPEWSSLPDFEDESKRLRFWEMLLTETRKKSLADWQAVFDADSNVFAEVFRSGAQLLDHPQLVHNGQVTTIDDPRLGLVRQPAPLVRFMDDPIQLVASAPALNEHSEQVRAAVAAANRTTPAPQA
ncbi:MAG TPA: CoA transferase, partial [Novosphingobium sp.]